MAGSPSLVRVLVVDDHPLVRNGLRAVVGTALPAVAIEETGSAAEAWQRIVAWSPDLLLLDVGLPDFSGLELVRRIRDARRPMRILMVAGEADGWTVREALRRGADGFVRKTLSSAELAAAVRSVLAGREVLCDASRQGLVRIQELKTEALDTAPPPGVLSPREKEVLVRFAEGLNTKSIADRLGISVKTVETHRAHLTRKLGTTNPAFLARYAIQHRLLFPGFGGPSGNP